jgi:ribosomal protein S18 acetylase RimI-like enzyme
MKTQSYTCYDSFNKKSEKHWLKNESLNSLFWEFSENNRSLSNPVWMGNVFKNNEIKNSALISKSSYLFLSTGLSLGAGQLAKYLARKKIMVKGVLGPTRVVDSFLQEWEKVTARVSSSLTKRFNIFESSLQKYPSGAETSLVQATDKEWPRVWLWAKAFATESFPQLDVHKSIQMAKNMQKNGRLYLLKDKKGQTKGMGGFGRSTPNALVVNMIYINPDDRRQGLGQDLVGKLIHSSRSKGYSRILLFSDFMEPTNFYRTMGLQEKGMIVEKSFS